MITKKLKTIIVMPAYNAEKTLEKTVRAIPPGIADEIILVDDCSKDKTVEIAKNIGLKTIIHAKNTGYGGNQKTCYGEALKAGADIVVMIHPDYQYDPKVIPHMIAFIENDICDFVLGNRIRTRKEAISSGMPIYKYFANRGLTIFENLILGQNLGEWHSGLRAYSRKVLETVPWNKNSDDFVFDQEMLIQSAYFGFRIGDVPVPSKYFAEASSINFLRSTKYGLETLVTILKLFLHKSRIMKCKIFLNQN
ncbi:MAG: glycosyl transferase family 2 [Elusimicrobia bacterium RIFOXYA2_FULL_40_6]|nr:MAG: glycosyl transferase family 2 [Elusimicrobia bacterium RIFOXYA2_FULL_40_6]